MAQDNMSTRKIILKSQLPTSALTQIRSLAWMLTARSAKFPQLLTLGFWVSMQVIYLCYCDDMARVEEVEHLFGADLVANLYTKDHAE